LRVNVPVKFDDSTTKQSVGILELEYKIGLMAPKVNQAFIGCADTYELTNNTGADIDINSYTDGTKIWSYATGGATQWVANPANNAGTDFDGLKGTGGKIYLPPGVWEVSIKTEEADNASAPSGSATGGIGVVLVGDDTSDANAQCDFKYGTFDPVTRVSGAGVADLYSATPVWEADGIVDRAYYNLRVWTRTVVTAGTYYWFGLRVIGSGGGFQHFALPGGHTLLVTAQQVVPNAREKAFFDSTATTSSTSSSRLLAIERKLNSILGVGRTDMDIDFLPETSGDDEDPLESKEEKFDPGLVLRAPAPKVESRKGSPARAAAKP